MLNGFEPGVASLPGFYNPVSAISHLAGAVVFLFLGLLLMRRGRGDTARLVYLGIFVLSCVCLFALSGVYHMMPVGTTAREVMARLDHSAIFLLIAGSFTPAHGILFRGWLRWGALLLVWATAITGIVIKVIFFAHVRESVGLSLYLGLGWMGGLSGILIAMRYGLRFIRLLLLGGIVYSAGAVLEFCGWPVLIDGVVHSHEVFHVAVLMGSFCHWAFTWQFARWQPAGTLDYGVQPVAQTAG